MAGPTWIAYGPNAALFRFSGDHAKLQRVTAALEEDPPDGLLEYVPGLSTLLLVFASSREFSLSKKAAETVDWMNLISSRSPEEPMLHEIPVYYDGQDLAEVAAAHRLSDKEVIRLHSKPTYSVHMLGFSPGFPYLGPLDPKIHTPRKAVPRSRIEAGSVAIGGPHTGIYTMETAGGWHIIGKTPVKIFDIDRSHPGRERDMFLLRPGDLVRFIPS